MSRRPKVIYLAKRHSSLDRQSFVARWKQHGALAMSLPIWRNMWKYAHCDLDNNDSALSSRDQWDGIGLVWYRSWDSLELIASQPWLRQPLLDDELCTFAGLVRDSAIMTEEVVLKDGPETPFELFVFLSAVTDQRNYQFQNAVRVVRSDQVKNGYTQDSKVPYIIVFEYWFLTEQEASEAGREVAETIPQNALALVAKARPIFRAPD